MRVLLLTTFVFLHALAIAQTPRKKQPVKPTRTVRPAQPAKPAQPVVIYKDMVYKLDKSTLAVKIDELTETGVVYREPANPTVKQTLPRAEVWKVVFSDGSVETISPLPEEKVVTTPAPSTASPGTSSPTAASASSTYSPSRAVATYANVNKFSHFHITVGPEFAYYPEFLNKGKAWLSDSTGFGMKQNIGASIRVDYQFLKPVAISLTAGYYGWELTRKYTRDGSAEYSETKKLTQIPVQVGLKIYPLGGLYIMPEGGATLLMSSVSTSEGHPTPANESVKSTPITYGGSLGYEIRGKALLIDLSLRYQLLNVKNLSFTEFQQTLSEQVGIASFRLGIGFNSPKK
ncbi:hypothetical protein [Fibrella arboris]|uniref:hypothetical protein n=1 Tax=Fibrella arboris TaxID=3242486 RepID=UPI0035230101